MKKVSTAILLLIFVLISCKTVKDTNNIKNNFKTIKDTLDKSYYTLNDTLKIILENNYVSGYQWIYEPNDFVTYLKQKDSIKLDTVNKNKNNIKIFYFKTVQKGSTKVFFHKKRSFEPDSLKLKNLYSKTITIK